MASGTFYPGTVTGSAQITGVVGLPGGVTVTGYQLRVDLSSLGFVVASSGIIASTSAAVSTPNSLCGVGFSATISWAQAKGSDGLYYGVTTSDSISGNTAIDISTGSIVGPAAGVQTAWPAGASGLASITPTIALTDLTTSANVPLGAVSYMGNAWSVALPALVHGHAYRLTLSINGGACSTSLLITRDFSIPTVFTIDRAWTVLSVIGPAVVQSWVIASPIRKYFEAAWALVTQINSPLTGAPSLAAIDAALRPLHTFRARLFVKWDRTNWVEETERLISASGVDDVDLRLRHLNSAEAAVSLDNSDNRYTLTNRASPLASSLPHIGHEIKIVAGYDGQESTVFLGFTESMTPTMSDRMAQVRALDRGAKWRSIRSSLPPQVLQTTDALARALLLTAGFVEGVDFALDVGDVIVPYSVAPDVPLLPELQALAQAEGGRAFFDENGVFQFWSQSRTRRVMSTPIVELSTDDHLYEVGYSTSPTGLATRISMEWLTRDYTGTPEIIYDAKVVFRIPPGYNDLTTGKYMPGSPVVIRAAPMDLTRWERFVPAQFTSLNTLTANTARNGSGSSVGTSVGTAPTQTVVAGTLLYYGISFGIGYAEVTLQNSTLSDVYVTVLKLSGTPQRSISPTRVTAIDPDAVEDIELVLQNPYTPDADIAADRAREELALRKDPLSRLDIPLADGLPFLRAFDVLRVTDGSIPDSAITVDGQVLRNSWAMSPEAGYTQNLILGSSVPAQFRALASLLYTEAAAVATTDGNPTYAWAAAAHPLVWGFGQWS